MMLNAYSPGECEGPSVGLLILEMDERRVRLLNLEAKDIGKATVKNLLKFVERNVPMMIGNKEIQVPSLHHPFVLLVTSGDPRRGKRSSLVVWRVSCLDSRGGPGVGVPPRDVLPALRRREGG